MRPGGEKKPISHFHDNQHSRHGSGARRPAPLGKPLPKFHERSRTRHQTSVLFADMKPSHRSMPVEIFSERGGGAGHIGEAEGFRLRLAAIKRDFGAAQGTRPIK